MSFKERNKVKKEHPKNMPKNGKKTPWENEMPHYDERTSCFVNVGTHYGVGVNQPIGHKSKPKAYDQVIPVGRPKTMQNDEIG